MLRHCKKHTGSPLLDDFGLSSSVPGQFHVVKEGKTWTEAQQYCRDKFTDLAVINNKADIEKIKSMIQNEGVTNVWIGLKNGIRPKWQWSRADEGLYGENEAEFRNWDTDAGQPSGILGEDCGAIRRGGEWHGLNCTKRRRFICDDETNSIHPYVLVKQKKYWTDAQRYCREKHTDLASGRNQAENDKIYTDILSGLAADAFPWIGLFRDAWEWSDGSSSSFRHWAPGEPNFGDGEHHYCARIKSSGLRNDAACHYKAHFICYGQARVKRTQIVRVKMGVTSDVDVEDPDVQKAFLQQSHTKRGEGRPSLDFKQPQQQRGVCSSQMSAAAAAQEDA
ncbi:macrophage mannose receptor 1-like [Engraulis encrasicolus]|uniref:macrophage mannose receptor 1-like n=1 Tax=Engraulis encrasicolus TaxID=184585 RepID=UPI002FD50608